MNSYLTEKDMKVLSRLTVSPNQKALIQEEWSKVEVVKFGFLPSLFMAILKPAITASLIVGNIIPNVTWLINVAVMISWLVLILVPLLSGIMVLLLAVMNDDEITKESKKIILSRPYISFFVGSAKLKNNINRLVTVIWIVMLASLGFILTAICLFFSCGIYIFIKNIYTKDFVALLKKIEKAGSGHEEGPEVFVTQ